MPSSVVTDAQLPTDELSPVVQIKMLVSHGDYRATFTGVGVTVLAAAEDAARQSTYGMGLFDRTDRLYEVREKYRRELSETIAAGGTYRGFGWCNFHRVYTQARS